MEGKIPNPHLLQGSMHCAVKRSFIITVFSEKFKDFFLSPYFSMYCALMAEY